MNKHIKLFFTLSILFISSTALAQEICDNGIDDDGDGRIDCYDGECSSAGACDDFFFGNVVECADDINVNTFAIRLQWASEDRSSNSHATPMVGDLDGNGIPEVIATNKQRRSLFILNGATGATLFSNTSLGFQPENVPVIGDIDRDEFGEILVSQDQGDDMALLDHEAQVIWTAKSSRNDAIGLPGFADFDEDGDVEIYYRNEVVDAATGNIIVTGTNSDWERNFTHGSLAVDVLADDECPDCAGLELISGNEIWSINEAAGTRTLIRDMDDDIQATPETSPFRSDATNASLAYYPKYYSNWDDQWSSVSAADYNLDGFMDLIITGALGTSSETFRGETTIFFWDVENGVVTTFHDPSNNFVRGPGRVNIGDVDGDGQLNANFVMNQKLYSLDENFGIHWIRPIKEGSSGFTGCSLFDFDGDGAVEVVYRSEESLLIVDGIGNGDNTTNIRNEIACVSRTQEEYPVIADVDGDGASEICLACYSNNNTPFNPYRNTEFAQVRIYESDGEAWMPARGVWNQHAYYNVNVNDDLTIPIEVQDHTAIFSPAGTCEYADGSIVPFASRPLNTFLNQAPILNEDGCVEFASPDIEFVGILSASDAMCPDATIDVTFEIRNIGDIAISGNLPVSYYAGDPRLASGSVLLDTEVSTLINFEPETTIALSQNITGVGGEFELFVVINDNGSTPPITVPLPTATIPECDTENNIQSTNVGFTRFDLITEKLFDNRKCVEFYVLENDTIFVPDNGSARAYYFGVVPGENGTFWVENFEDLNNGDQSDTGETAWTTNPGTGNPSFYGVADFSGSKMFNVVRSGGANDSGIVTWTSEAIDISNHTDVTATLDLFESGNQESSGRWRDFAIATYEIQDRNGAVTSSGEFINGRQFGNFDYAQAILTGINNSGQNDSLLTITVSIHNTSTSEFHYVDNVAIQGTPVPVPTIQTEADGFDFNWYNLGDTSNAIHNGSTISQLPEGQYIVEGFFGTTQCFSALDTITINRIDTAQFFVHTFEISQETNCAVPDGSAFAFAYTQIENGIPQDTLLQEDGFPVSWRINGDVTNTIIATGNQIDNRTAQDYAADILDTFSGCTNSALASITTPNQAIQGLSASAVNINTCGGTGTVSASVNGNTSDYSFEWFDGASVKPAIDFIGVDYTVSEIGDYTVIARDNVTQCVSEPVTVTVGDDSNSPILNASEVQGNSNCGGNPNGSAIADVNGIIGDSGFDYTWFIGNNTIPANEIPGAALLTASFGVGEWEMNGLSTGVYTIILENVSTNCTDTTTVSISDNTIDPSFDLGDVVATPNTSCDAFNGSIDASAAITPASSYAFSLYAGVTVDPDSLVITNSSGVFASLEPKTYTISATDNTTQCTTPPINVTVNDEPDHPIISTSVTNDSFCIDGNGQIFVTSSSNVTEPGSYTYEIFDGFSLTNEIVAKSDITVSDGSSGHTFVGLEDGNYRIRVTNDNLGCDSFTDVVVGDISEIPTFSTSRLINDNSSCDLANPNGAISVSIDEVGFNASDYDWEWYQGSSVDPDFLLANPESGEGANVTINGYTISDNALNNIPGGDYTLFARDTETGCKTVDLTLTVNNVPYLPNVVIVQEEPQTDCGDGNGILRAYVEDPDLPCVECIESDGFSFQWQFNGVDIVDGSGSPLTNGSDNISGAQTSTISGLVADEYSVIVIETNTNCPATETFILGAAQINPIVSFASRTPNTICDDTNPAVNYTGSITVTSTFDGSDFTNNINATYEWYDGDDTGDPLIVGENGPTLSNRQEGFYTVLVRNAETGCPSNPITVEVLENHDEPAVTFTGIVGNSVCDPALADDSSNDYNGEITATVTGGSGTFSYQWFSALNGELVGETNATLSTAQHGSYSVRVTDDLFGCVATFSESIPDVRTDPDLLLASVVPTDVTICGPANNGSVTVSTVDGFTSADPEFSNYSFEWFTGAGTGTPHPSGETSNILSNLTIGEYTVRAINDVTGCASTTRTVEVEESLIDITASRVIQHLTDCDAPNGNIEVTASMASGAEPASYSFEWFFGSGTSEVLDATDLVDGSNFAISTNGINEGTASGLENGTYTVRITNDDTQCDETFEYIVENNRIIPTITVANIDVTDNTICDPAQASGGTFNGIIDPRLAVTPTIASGVTYEFELFDAADVSQGTTTTTFTNVAPGNYTITASITSPVNGGLGCTSTAASVVMGNNLTLPDFDLTGNPDIFCNADNGSIDIDFSGTIPADGFEIEIFTNPGATASQQLIGTSVSAFPISSNSDLISQTYYVRFINNTTGCSAIEPVFVDQVLDQPTVDSATPTPDNFCVSANGTITVVGSNLGSSPLYSLYTGPDAVGTPVTQASNVFSGLGTGTYTVTITKNDAGESGCESDGLTVFVGETLDVVTAALSVENEQTSCDGNTPNGRLVASGTTTIGGVLSYTFFQGSTTNPAANVTSGIINPVPTVVGNQVDGLPAGLYTVLIENTTTGCTETAQETIQSMPTLPQITGAASSSPNTTCTAPFTGEITVTADDNGSAEPLDGANGYTFELYLGNSINIGEIAFATINENDGDAVFSQLEDGDYMVRVIDNNTSCEVETTLPVTVLYTGPVIDPAADLTPGVTRPSNCFERSGTIDLSGLIDITGGDGTQTVTVRWFEGFDIGGTAVEVTTSENLGAPDEGDNVTGFVAGPVALGGTGGQLFNYRLQDVPAINYAALLTLDNGCTDTLFINIPEVNAPTVAGTVTQQPTDCSSPSNGTFEFDITALGGDLATNYEYTLFSGIENVDPDSDNLGATYDPPIGDGDIIARTPVPDLNGTAQTENVVVSSTLDPGTYTLIVVRAANPADECPVYSQTFTLNEPDRPDLSTPPTVVDNSNCATDGDGGIEYNGSITVTASHTVGTNDFTFDWFTVDESTDTYTAISNGATSVNGDVEADVTITLNALGNGTDDNSRIEGLGELTGGLRYAVIATHTGTGCADTLHMDLFDDPVPVIISGNSIPITVCTPGAVGGFNITSFSPGVAGNYTFMWFDGTSEVVGGSSKLDYTAAGDFYVIATNVTNGCSARLDFSIENLSEDPEIALNGGITNNTICAGGPLGLNPVGAIDTQVTNDDGGSYIYRWYLGDVAAFNGATATRLEDGVDPGNGSFPAGAGTIALDDGTLSVSGLAAGTYTLEVLDDAGTSLDCFSVEDFVVEDDLADIVIDAVATTPQVFCNPDENGTATISNVFLDGILTDATTANVEFRWFSDNVAAFPLPGTPLAIGTQGGANNSQVTDLPSGTYYVDVYNETTDCVSELVEFEILNEEAFPAVQVSVLEVDSLCTTTAGSGSILASVSLGGNPPSTDLATEYTFDWYEGTGNAGDANFALAPLGSSVTATGFTIGGVNGEQVDNLPAGTYEVIVTNNAGGTTGDNCSTTASITIDQFTPIISIADADITIVPNMDCTPTPGGSAEVNRVTVTAADGGSYFITSTDPEWANLTFEWYNDPTGGAIQDNDERYENLGLDDGTYYVIISDWSTTGCAMDVRKEVIVPDDIPPLTLTLTEDAPDNFCAPVTAGNGQISLEVSIDGSAVSVADATQYTIEWFEGSGTGVTLGTTITTSTLSNNDLTVSNIPDGTYTARVTKNGAGATTPALSCFAIAEIDVSSEEEEITLEADVDYTRAPNTVCDPVVVGDYNGSITIVAVTEGGSKILNTDPEFADYSFSWTGENGVALPGTATVAGPSLSTVQGAIYEVTVQNDVRNCISQIIPIEVEESLTFPTVSLTSNTPNTHCDGATTLTGELEATIAGGSGNYTFEWFIGDTPGGSNVPPADIATVTPVSTASNLDGGSYTVVATDVTSGCTVTGTFFVDESLDVPTLDVTAIQSAVFADSLCIGNSGTIRIADVDISGNDLTLYNISVTDNGGLDIGASPYNATALNLIEITGLAAGDYSIDAVNITTNCEIATATVTIQNTEVNPLVTLVSITPDQACAPGVTNAGAIDVVVDQVYDHTNPRYTFLWELAGGGALPVPVADNEATISGIPAGNYQVTVTNNNTGCDVTRVYEVPNEPEFPIISSANFTDNTNCTPDNGSFNLVEVIYDDNAYDNTGSGLPIDGVFELRVLRSADDSQQGITSNVPYTFNNLAPDDYYAVVRHIGSNCVSEPFNFTIEDNPAFPVIDLTLNQADSTCQAGFTPNGQVTALANGLTHTDPDYGFQWYFGAAADIGTTAILLDGTPLANGSIPVGFNESTISGLAAGLYTVQVSQTSTGCVTTEQIVIPNNPVEVELVDFNVTSSTDCFGNGVIDITQVNRSGQPDNVADYQFEFFTENPTNPGASPVFTVPTDGPVFNTAMGATTYFILATHADLGCVAPVVQTDVLENVERPVIALSDFEFQTNCDPDNPNGRFVVLADGQPDNADYDFQWFFGTTISDTLTTDDYQGGVNLSGANTNDVSGLAAGFYTVVALSNITGCTTQETFEMTDLAPTDLDIVTTVSDNTSCEEPNGIVSASVIIGQNLEEEVGLRTYDYYWFVGTLSAIEGLPPTQANFVGQTIAGLPEGNYVVLAVDQSDNFCQSIYKQVNVNDPGPNAGPQFDLDTRDVTVCFDDQNGYAEVLINDLSTVDIVWFNEQSDSIGSGFFIDSLSAGDIESEYLVVVTDRITQCFRSETFTIRNLAEPPSAPFVIVNNGRNNCSFANGSAIANVDGVTNNFLFEWFDPLDIETPYATGSEVSNLDSITYLVRATDITTGCQSPFTQVPIDYERVDPSFQVQVDNSICLRTEDGSTNQFTGSAIIVFDEFNLPSEYEWTYLGDDNFQTEEVISRDSRLIDAFPGNYRVRFVADNGCEYFANFSVDVTLNIYNGVSANDDGKNDFFLIDCIDFFPQNNVKIFNRAGQRIFEVDGYDNRNLRFEGNSNVGGGGLVLPSGTYFYLVDLGNGVDPIQGYLELVR